jgi:hypothetical protein
VVKRWVHSVSVYPGSTLILYVDGKEVDRAADSRAQLPKGDGIYFFSGGPRTGITGLLDEVAIYDFAIASDRVRQHFEAGSL